MKSTDRTIVLVVLGLVVVGALWFGLISPKRSELSKLDEDLAQAQAEVTQAEQLAATAVEAKDDYRSDYERLIALGKAVPGDDDVASFIDQVDSLATRAGVDFSSLKLAAGGGGTATTTAAPAATDGSPTPAEGDDAAAATLPAPATETAAALLPLGATIGTAGLPVMPYDLIFTGTFFEVADFMASLDDLVRLKGDTLGVEGRLVTVDGFGLAPDPERGFPALAATLHVTTYVAPADQGATGGATPAAPTTAVPADASAGTPTVPTASATAPTP
jgi:Tfp pilus assembly protein PilO